MADRLKRLVLIVFIALFGAFAFTAPVFADPDPNDPMSAANTEQVEEITDFSDENRKTCYDEAGAVGWLVCPGSGFLAGIIDGAFNILQDLIQIKPISRDVNSPFRMVWEYFRNFTDIILATFLVIIIISQLSGLGINNYGVKRALPRLIIGAILANLSLDICMIAMDLSTIFGTGLYQLFQDIQAAALANGNVNDFAKSVSIADITAAILGVGVAGAAGLTVALTMNGGVMGLMVMLLPVILSGVLAVISAIITMAARQALVYLLVMVSPLALVCYTLPNTEKWFRRWYDMFVRMLLFYPMFSVLYGASQLAGIVIITSADNWITVILGIAVRVLPLFFTFPMLRMTGTMLGGIDGFVHRMANPATRSVRGYAEQRRALERGARLADTRPNRGMSTRLAQYLESRRAKRDFDLKNYTANNADTYMTNAMATMRTDGIGSNRGYRLRAYQAQQARKMENSIIRERMATDLDEGIDENKVGARHRAAIAETNARMRDLVIDDHMNKVRQRQVSLNNAKSRADRIKNALEMDKNYEPVNNDADARRIRGQFQDNFQYSDFRSQEARQSLSSVMSSAIAARNKVDREIEAEYEVRFDNLPAGPGPLNNLLEAVQVKDANAMEAALKTVAKRGDWDLLDNKVAEITPMLVGEENIEMQKRLADTLVQYKKDDWRLALYGKALMMRRGMNGSAAYEGKEINLRPFVTFAEFCNERRDVDGDGNLSIELDAAGNAVLGSDGKEKSLSTGENAEKFAKVSIDQLADDEKNASFVLELDKNGWKQMSRDMYGEDEKGPGAAIKMRAPTKNGREIAPLAHQLKYLRSAFCDSPEGEKLKFEILTATGNFDRKGQLAKRIQDDIAHGTFDPNTYFDSREDYLHSREHQKIIHDQIIELVRDMSPAQIAKQKSDTIKAFNAYLLSYNMAEARRNGTPIDADICRSADDKIYMSKEFISALEQHGQLSALCERNSAMRLGEMNTSIAEWLGLQTKNANNPTGWHDPRNNTPPVPTP